MIKLTNPDGNPVFIAAQHVVSIYTSRHNNTAIQTTGEYIVVAEPAEEVARRVQNESLFVASAVAAMHALINGKHNAEAVAATMLETGMDADALAAAGAFEYAAAMVKLSES